MGDFVRSPAEYIPRRGLLLKSSILKDKRLAADVAELGRLYFSDNSSNRKSWEWTGLTREWRASGVADVDLG